MTARKLQQQMRPGVLPDGTRALIVDYVVPDDAPPDIREGLARRSLVNSGYQCPCGARMHPPSRASRRRAKRAGKALQGTAEHEADCPAGEEILVPRLRAWLA